METKPPTKVESQPFRRGIYTTEFWITVALLALQFALAIKDLIPPSHAVTYATITGAVYTVLRTIKKIRAGELTVDQAFLELEASGQRSEVSAEDLAEVDLAGKAAGAWPPGSGAGVGPKRTLTGVLAIAAVAMLSGCTAFDQDFRRKVESVEAQASGIYDAATGEYSAQVSGRVYFREPAPADAKRVKLPKVGSGAAMANGKWQMAKVWTLQPSVLDLRTDLGGAIPTPFVLDVDLMSAAAPGWWLDGRKTVVPSAGAVVAVNLEGVR